MNLSQLHYFRKLAEVEHYGKASEELFITQPSLSNSIANLEKELGVRLFERVGRNVRLTPYGAEFNELVSPALNQIDKAVDLMRLYGDGFSGQIRIGTVISIQRNFLPRLLNAFREQCGNDIVLDIHQETTYGCVQGLQEGKFDVAFCGRVPDERGVAWEPMLAQNLVVGVDATHELAQCESVSFDDLRGYPLVSYRNESYVSTVVGGLLKRRGLAASQGFNDEISAASLVVAEKTVAAVMLNTLDEGTIEGFASVPISDVSQPFHTVYLAHREDDEANAVACQLVEFARSYADYPKGKTTQA